MDISHQRIIYTYTSSCHLHLIFSQSFTCFFLKPISLKTGDLPPIRLIQITRRRHTNQFRIIDFTRTIRSTLPRQAISNELPHSLPFKPRPVQKAKVFTTRGFAREIQPPHVRTQILMHFEGCAGRPIGIAAVGPGFRTPARIRESDGIRDIGRAIHIS